jgi:hypothetical protein
MKRIISATIAAIMLLIAAAGAEAYRCRYVTVCNGGQCQTYWVCD